MTVQHASSIPAGAGTFDISVPGVEDALVGLYADPLLLGHGYTDSQGNATIALGPVPDGTSAIHVTVTAYNKIPYLGQASVGEASILRGQTVESLAPVATAQFPWTDPEPVLTDSFPSLLFYRVDGMAGLLGLVKEEQTLTIYSK